MAVPKRLLKRAVDRNALRRISREHWRLAHADPAFSERVSGHYLLRLKVRPTGFSELTRPARKRLWHDEVRELLGRLTG
jgi:RNase P protein component